MSGRTLRALLQYDYPGNVRELEHLVERAVIRAGDGEALDVSHFDLWRRAPAGAPDAALPGAPLTDAQSDLLDAIIEAGLSVTDLEGALVDRALRRSDGNRSAAARSLRMSRRQFNYRLENIRAGRTPDPGGPISGRDGDRSRRDPGRT